MMLTLAALLAACDAESTKDSAGRDSPVEDTGADSADTGETGDSEDTGDTGDTADSGDSGETADVDTCDPTPYVERDTSVDTAPLIDFLASVDTAGTEFRDTGHAGDCETFPTDAFGHPRLRCANIVVDLSDQVNEFGSYQDAESEWLGDLDGDGADDLLITMRTSSTSGVSTYLRYGGGEIEDLGTVDPLEFAHAWALQTDERQLFRGGDFNGDGLADVFTEDDDEALGVLLSDGSRFDGLQEVWPEGEVWNPGAGDDFGFSGVRNYAGNIRQAWAADVTGDGLDDAIASPAFTSASQRGVAVVEGGADFESKGNLFTDSWNFVGGANCASDRNLCRTVQGVPVGDLDGDGMADLLVSSGFPAEYQYLVSPGELPRCTMAVEDVGWSALTDGERHSPGVAFPLPGGGDFDGDGDGDLMMFVDEGGTTSGLAGFLVRGGETRLHAVQDLRSLPDRLELPRFYSYGPFRLRAADVSASDLDADGADEILVGGYGDVLIRARLVVLPAPVGVQDSMDVGVDWVSEFDTHSPFAIPAYGRGDHDADGFEDLFVMVDDESSVGFALFDGADMTAGGWVP